MVEPKINLKVNKQLQVLVDQQENYFEILRDVHRDLSKKRHKSYLCFTYLALCAATLEYSLNSLFIDYCIGQFGPNDYKPFAETYLSMNFKAKLNLAPVTISGNQFMFKKDHKSLKDLENLITRRNRMLHNKSYLQNLANLKPNKEGVIHFEIRDHISTLSPKECLVYGNALGKLKQDLLDPFRKDGLVESDLIVRMEHEKNAK